MSHGNTCTVLVISGHAGELSDHDTRKPEVANNSANVSANLISLQMLRGNSRRDEERLVGTRRQVRPAMPSPNWARCGVCEE
jgi:hypothetical protein